MPYLNRRYQEKHPLGFLGNGYVDPPEDANSKRWVDTCSFPQRIDETGKVIFEPRPDRKDWRRMKEKDVRPNCVVYCTGYVHYPVLPTVHYHYVQYPDYIQLQTSLLLARS